MACISGKNGVITVSGTAIAQVKSYSLNESADTTECSYMGLAGNYREYKANMKDWSGSAELVWDRQDDVTALDVGGDAVALILYPEGNDTATDWTISGNVIITAFDISGSTDDSISATISFQGTGALTRASE